MTQTDAHRDLGEEYLLYVGARTPLSLRMKIRKMAGSQSAMPIKVVWGRWKPKIVGQKSYYTNKSGEVIHHPNAYGYPKVYHPSTRQLTVGVEWILRRLPQPLSWSKANGQEEICGT